MVMIINTIFSNEVFLYFLIPFLIFIFRVIDVSLGTLRIIFTSKGIKFLASTISFFEVLIWLLAISQIIQNLTNVLAYIAYAGGFACGTYIGIVLEEKISIGKVRVRVITKKNLKRIINDLPHTRYVFTSDNANSTEGKIKTINAFLDRKYLKEVLAKIKEHDKDAFYTVEDLRIVKRAPVNIENTGVNKKHYFNRMLRK